MKTLMPWLGWVLACAAMSVVRADEPPAPPPAASVAAPGGQRPPDRLDLDTTSIRGNQELPKVLYIVPWKEPGLAEPAGRPLNSLVDEVLAPVDREVFRRQMRYFDQLYVGAASAATTRIGAEAPPTGPGAEPGPP
jgi:hypothetical protein